ncbi:MAG: hypothetical protein AAF664_05120 [Planctomycetota bacterium]
MSTPEPSEVMDVEETSEVDEGPGCLPGIMAATVLMGIIGFIGCGFSTWILFQQRTEFATRTLREGFLPEIEQSRFQADEKEDLIAVVETIAQRMEAGGVEDWQALGVMQRLQRLPVLQWGDLQAIELSISEQGSPEQTVSAIKQFDRLRWATDEGKITSMDLVDVLDPVQIDDPTVSSGRRLGEPIQLSESLDVVDRARLLADRENIPESVGEYSPIADIVAREIEAGLADGGF